MRREELHERVPSATPATLERPAFALERFGWDAPDRLEVSGWFSGLDEPLGDAPALVVRCADGAHPMHPVPDGCTGPPGEGRHWRAVFAWRRAPAPFDAAELAFGSEVRVELPGPSEERTGFGERVLALRAAPVAHVEAAETAASERVRLEAELISAREKAFRLDAKAEQTGEELLRARHDLDAERASRAVDADRFQEALAHVQASAEAALADERHAAELVGRELDACRAEIATLRRRLQGLEQSRLRLQETQRRMVEACADAQHLLDRPEAVETALERGS